MGARDSLEKVHPERKKSIQFVPEKYEGSQAKKGRKIGSTAAAVVALKAVMNDSSFISTDFWGYFLNGFYLIEVEKCGKCLAQCLNQEKFEGNTEITNYSMLIYRPALKACKANCKEGVTEIIWHKCLLLDGRASRFMLTS